MAPLRRTPSANRYASNLAAAATLALLTCCCVPAFAAPPGPPAWANRTLTLPPLAGTPFAERVGHHAAEASTRGASGLPDLGVLSSTSAVAASYGALLEQGWRLGHQEALVELLPSLPGLSVELTVTVEAIDDGVAEFTLRTELIDVDALELAGEVSGTVAYSTQFGQIGVIVIKLDKPLDAGHTVQVRIRYTATLDCNKKTSLLRSCTFEDQFSQVMFFRYFADHAKALHAPYSSTLHVLTPGGLTAAAPGNPQGFIALSDGRLVWTFEQPERTENGGIAVADYAQTGAGPNDVGTGGHWLRLMTLTTYSGVAQPLLDSAAAMIGFYAAHFGAFPWAGLSLVQVADNLGGGYAPLSAIFMLKGIFGAKPNAQGWTSWNELTAHEIAHQWWGNLARPMSSADVSLSESLAEFSSCLYTENTLNSRGQIIEDNLSYIYTVDENDDRPLGSSAVFSSPAYVPIVYHKGAVVLDMLRWELGETVMLKGLETYAAAFDRDYARVDDLREAMEKASGRDLGWFFKQWWQEKGRLDLELAAAVSALPDGGFRVRVRVAQLGAKPMRFKLPLRIVFADGSSEDEAVDVLPPDTGWISVVSVDVATRPVMVRPDLGRRLLRRMRVLDGADVTLDGIVDGMDLMEMAFRYRRTIVWKGGFLPNTAWDELFDSDGSYTVDAADLDLLYARAGAATIDF